VSTPRARIESRIQNITEALGEARSPDVREFLGEMLNEQLVKLAEYERKANEPRKGSTRPRRPAA
jgi:hypothetical protein